MFREYGVTEMVKGAVFSKYALAARPFDQLNILQKKVDDEIAAILANETCDAVRTIINAKFEIRHRFTAGARKKRQSVMA